MYRQKIAGFTLIELMMTLTVLAVIVSLSKPSLCVPSKCCCVSATSETIYSAIKQARSEAIKQNKQVNFHLDTVNNCIGIDDNLADVCDCTVADPPVDTCTVNGQLRTQDRAEYSDITIPTGDITLAFDASGKPGAAATITVDSASIASDYDININPIGLIKLTKGN